MSSRKLGLAIILSSVFGFIGCSGDSSSNAGGSNGGSFTLSCKVVSENPLVIESTQLGITTKTTFRLKDNRLETTMEFSQNVPADECEEYEDNSDYELISCSGKKIVTLSKEELSEEAFESSMVATKTECKESNGTTVRFDDEED